MNKVKLVIYGDTPYMSRLAACIQKEGPKYLEIVKCKAAELPEAIKVSTPDILLGEIIPPAEANIPKAVTVILLTKQSPNEHTPTDGIKAVFRYQPAQEILRQVFRCYQKDAKSGQLIWRSTGQLEMTAVYAPGGHPLQLPFSLLCAMEKGKKRKTLYINLAEFSGMNAFLEEQKNDSFSDLIYGIRYERHKQESYFPMLLQSVLHHGAGFDYIQPPENPQDMYEIQKESMDVLLQLLEQQTDYEAVVWNCGYYNHLTAHVMGQCLQIWCLVNDPVFCRCRREEFEQYLKGEEGQLLAGKIQIVPLGAKGAAFVKGADALEQLKTGTFAEQVREQTGFWEEKNDTGDGPAQAAYPDTAGYDT